MIVSRGAVHPRLRFYSVFLSKEDMIASSMN